MQKLCSRSRSGRSRQATGAEVEAAQFLPCGAVASPSPGGQAVLWGLGGDRGPGRASESIRAAEPMMTWTPTKAFKGSARHKIWGGAEVEAASAVETKRSPQIFALRGSPSAAGGLQDRNANATTSSTGGEGRCDGRLQ
ncbi:hypothetical protein THAOC_19542, partial [Thalassiosira oceanica]